MRRSAVKPTSGYGVSMLLVKKARLHSMLAISVRHNSSVILWAINSPDYSLFAALYGALAYYWYDKGEKIL